MQFFFFFFPLATCFPTTRRMEQTR